MNLTTELRELSSEDIQLKIENGEISLEDLYNIIEMNFNDDPTVIDYQALQDNLNTIIESIAEKVTDNERIEPFEEEEALLFCFLYAAMPEDKSILDAINLNNAAKTIFYLLPIVEKNTFYQIFRNEYYRYVNNSIGQIQLLTKAQQESSAALGANLDEALKQIKTLIDSTEQ